MNELTKKSGPQPGETRLDYFGEKEDQNQRIKKAPKTIKRKSLTLQTAKTKTAGEDTRKRGEEKKGLE